MEAYKQNIAQWLPTAQGLYKNPFNNDMFNQENTIGQDQAARVGARNKSNILNNANALGYGTSGGMFNSMMNRAGADTSMMQGQAFRGAVGNASQRAMTGLGMSSAFQPLMTGSNSNFTQTQQQSGLGTWLPQLAGMGIGAGMAAMTGGSSLAATGGMSRAAGGMSSSFGGGTASGGSYTNPMFGGNTGSPFPSFGGTGYGYGSSGSSGGNFVNPFMFGGR
jgi:hypothetical protein